MSNEIKASLSAVIEGGIEGSNEAQIIGELADKIKALPAEQQQDLIEDPLRQVLSDAISNHEGEDQAILIKAQNTLFSQESVEVLPNGKNFASLKEEYGSYIATGKSMAFFQEQFEGIVNEKAPNLPPEIRNTMMLPVWRRWIKHIDDVGTLAAEGVMHVVSLGSDGKEVEESSGETLISEMLQEIEDFTVRTNKVYNSVTPTGKKDIDFTNASIIDAIYRGENDPEKLRLLNTNHEAYYNETRKKTEKYAERIKDMDASIGGMIRKFAGDDFGKKLGEYAKENPWLGILLSMLGLGDLLEGFIDVNSKKRGDSLAQLSELSSTTGNSVSGMIPDGFFTNFDFKKLDPFFDYLNSQKIDFTHESFWKNLLSGDTDNLKVKGFYSLLSDEKGTIFTKEDFKNEGKGMIEKLNSLPKKKQEVKQAELKRKKAELKKSLTAYSGGASTLAVTAAGDTAEATASNNETKTDEGASEVGGYDVVPTTVERSDAIPYVESTTLKAKDTPNTKTDRTTQAEQSHETPVMTEAERNAFREQFTAYRNIEIREALLEATKFPVILAYEEQDACNDLGIPTPTSLDYKNGQFFLGEVPYNISFSGVTHDRATIEKITLDTAEISSQNLTLGVKAKVRIWGEQKEKISLPKKDVANLLIKLIDNESVVSDIPTEDGGVTSGKYTISKA